MDKIQPLLVHKFWILFGVTVILPPIGWWTATGELDQQIQERTTTLENTFSGISSGQDSPNQDWIKEINDRNQQRRVQNRAAQLELWNRQLDRMVWPDSLAEPMADAPYRVEQSGTGQSQFDVTGVPYNYSQEYPEEIRRIWQIVAPVSDTSGTKKKVKFPIEKVPRVPETRWEALPPSWKEMWDAQEDVWLFGSLFSAIARVNGAANTAVDAHVKEIQSISMFGGERKGPGQAAGQTAQSARRSSPFGSSRGGQSSSADFPLTEEFAKVTSGETRKSQPRGYGRSSILSLKPAKVATVDTDSIRYVDKGDVSYRTRGFYLKVIVDHRRVPDLLIELLNCEWPVEIVRVQQGPPGQSQSQGASGFVMAAVDMGGSDDGMDDSDGDDDDATGGDEEDVDDGIEEDDADTDDGTDGADAFGGDDDGFGEDFGPRTNSPFGEKSQTEYSRDPNLATVVVAGLMTIYNPPKTDEQVAGTVDGQNPVQPPAAGAVDTNATGSPGANNTIPAATNPQ